MSHFKRLIIRAPKYIWYLFCLVIFYPIGRIAKVLFPKYRGVWIVSERGSDARDNGYHFFKYIRENHPEIKAYYIIEKKSADYHKVAKLGNIVKYKSLKHHFLFAVSDYKISSHIFGYSPDVLSYNRFQKLGLIKGKLVFLQHGIIVNDIEWMFYPKTKLDLFVCGARPEYEAVIKRYGYPSGVVKYLGLCRYDALNKPCVLKNRILLMLTWRIDVCAVGNRDKFTQSEYYRKLQSFINNQNLIDYLDKNDLELVFYPHFEIQRFLKDFHSVSPRVIIASFNDYDVQELLMNSKMLITDFSSVFFDFAYMGKPIVYYQFDDIHYAHGYFDYGRDGFGPVLKTEDEVINYLAEKVNDGFLVDDMYKARAETFFEIRDDNNCERNFNAILSL